LTLGGDIAARVSDEEDRGVPREAAEAQLLAAPSFLRTTSAPAAAPKRMSIGGAGTGFGPPPWLLLPWLLPWLLP